MLDGLGMAETTPGPLIMVTQFVGFLAAFREATGLPPLIAATLGAILTTWVTFLPCFLWIFVGAPYVERLTHAPRLAAALQAVTAAVVGVILNLALFFGYHVLWPQGWGGGFDAVSALLALGAAVALFRYKRNVVHVIAACALLGLAVRLLG